jgi:hypothetical protein
VQLFVAVLHAAVAFAGVLHDEQLPPQQTPLVTVLVVHAVRSGSLPAEAQVCVPVAQDVAPTWHGLPSVQWAPAEHMRQLPLPSQTPFEHAVPAVLAVTPTHAEVPLAHDVVPTSQSVGLHGWLAVHETHCPPLHTMLVPHEVPFATFDVLPHTDAPLVQEVVPVWQTLPPG